MVEEPIDTVEDKLERKTRNRRSTDLLATFPNGYAAGWAMAVPECFRDALDIKLTERIQKHPETGKALTVMVWTQGKPPIYSFSAGDILYDTSLAYGSKWSNALAKISVSLQVESAVPDKLSTATSKIGGWVYFSEYHPVADGSRLGLVAKHRMTQDEFVATLKKATLPNGTSLLPQK
jgi:hypothetical protein